MLTFTNIDSTQLTTPSCLTIGNFDGLHRGHQALLQELIRIAAAGDSGRLPHPLLSGFVTFSPHPLAVLRPDHPHWLLTTPEERVQRAAELGIDFAVIHTFSKETAALSATEFVTLLKEHLNLAVLVVGPDFALGKGREGDLQLLRRLGEAMDFSIHVIEPVEWQGLSVRSSRIRQALREGDIALAATMLGRPYHVRGPIVQGDQRGRTIGIPTANVQTPDNKLMPADGVYATRARLSIGGRDYHFGSVTNLGVRPTVDGLHRRLEVHLFDFPPLPTDSHFHRAVEQGDIYGHELTVEFIARLRGEMRFSGLDALVAQIRNDMAAAKEILANDVRQSDSYH
ncbi:MAG: bifunctional riboflavin kinase/FAD synthetase [Caldilineaceae bacterium]|nr:bifunctional riboflavin kinase/FAD synthetase [Caldilineaceae bacterium]